MLRIKNYTTLLFIWITLFSCQADSGVAKELKPEKVYRIVYEIYPNEWYQKQAKLWKMEIEKDPSNENAWYNYYNANRYAHFEDIEQPEKKKRLDKIIADMDKAIPGTYTCHLLTYWNDCDFSNMHHVEEAYKINPDRPDTYYSFLSQAMVNGDENQADEFCKKLYDSQDIAPWLLNYNYNVLMSTGGNAVLISNGDNDTYPVWVLQKAKNIRKDVTLLNISMLAEENYFNNQLKTANIEIKYKDIKERAEKKTSGDQSKYRTFFFHEFIYALIEEYPDIPLYFALTVYNSYYEPFEENLYVVGLAYRYSNDRFDNVALIKKNLEKRFRLDHLEYDFYGESFPGKTLASRVNMNYVSPMILLAEHYLNSGESEKAQSWKSLSIQIAKESGYEDAVVKINKKFEK